MAHGLGGAWSSSFPPCMCIVSCCRCCPASWPSLSSSAVVGAHWCSLSPSGPRPCCLISLPSFCCRPVLLRLLVLVVLAVPWALAVLPVVVLRWRPPPPGPGLRRLHRRCRCRCLLLPLFLILILILVLVCSVLPRHSPLPIVPVWVIVVFLSSWWAVWRGGAVSGGW